MKANMRRTALPEPLCTVVVSNSSARSRLADEISQLTDDEVRWLLDVLNMDDRGSALGPSGCSCDVCVREVRCLIALSAGVFVAPALCLQGQSFFRKSLLWSSESLLWSRTHGVNASAGDVGVGVGRGIQAGTPPVCCGAVAVSPVMTARCAGVTGP